jgi:hypothetical protein
MVNGLVAGVFLKDKQDYMINGLSGSEVNNIVWKTLDIKPEFEGYQIYKLPQAAIDLVHGGVVGDRHFVVEPNSKSAEVVLLSKEFLEEINFKFKASLQPGSLGENILTSGINIDSFREGTILHIGNDVKLLINDQRSFCFKLLLPIRKSMTVNLGRLDLNKRGLQAKVIQGGTIKPGDKITATLPANAKPWRQLNPIYPLTKEKLIYPKNVRDLNA